MSKYKIAKTPGDTEWFRHDRFGMFIHFGLYALPSRHEWVKKIEEIPEEKYQKYFEHFNPDMLNLRNWARKAKEAGMKYVVLTTKHHEGFCLFDTKYTDYNVMNTPYGKDIVRQYVDALREEGLKVGFYYSLIDWHHPDFPIDVIHPRARDKNAEELDRGRDMKKYAEYMRNQVTELLTNYGEISIIWFDFSFTPGENDTTVKDWMQFGGGKGKDQWEAEKLIETVRKLQPNIIINNRCGINQDIVTPEQIQATKWPTYTDTGELATWETCQTFSGSWGYHRDESTWKSPEMLVNLLVNTVAYGGNLIMNVGPTSRGYFDERVWNSLEVYEKWMKYNSRSIYGCTMADPEFIAPNGIQLTQSEDGKRLYIHLQTYPMFQFAIENLGDKIEYAQFLHDGSEILYTVNEKYHNAEEFSVFSAGDNSVSFKVPPIKPNFVSPVIEVFLK